MKLLKKAVIASIIALLSRSSFAAEESIMETKFCMRDALARTGAASYEACGMASQLEALDGRVTNLESMPKSKTNWEEHVALVRMHDSHLTDGASMYYKTTTPDNAFEDLRTEVTEAMAEVFTNELGGLPMIKAMLDNPVETEALVTGDRSLGAAFAAARQSNAILLLEAKFQTPNPTVMPTSAPTDKPTAGPTMVEPTSSPTYATGGPYNWGNLGTGVYATVKRFDAPTEPTDELWTAACDDIGLSRATGDAHPGTGSSYSASQSSSDVYTSANNFYVNHVRPTLSSSEAATFYNNVVVLQGSNADCWAYNYSAGSMTAFGGPSNSAQWAWCRRNPDGADCPDSDPRGAYGSCNIVVKYHIYLCD